ncbi:LLM class flavin-dependent oxidoreductase [Gorillibacterium timonense]|uniref:LLM class flavin-dependent oxidoreductase n=1 Tax=Gorillibacterium timonense TaxID=1689269 RepID=UPI00071D801E|nr:LLM class flavin-dependent oxidoreductase [Gorillibacterium timonense]
MTIYPSVTKSADGRYHAPFSVLDLAPIVAGSNASDALRRSLDLAQHAEKWGYQRFWLAEHHNMAGVASSATAVVIGHIAAGTSTIRVGSGGIMLPNHAPLMVAEQFGTLESLFPGRIDLGLGRAPGSDQPAARAIRRGLTSSGQDFPALLGELRSYLDGTSIGVQAVPGRGLAIPIWLLGSSGFSAELAGRLGLPFAFASHFSPEYVLPALELYRTSFQPSLVLEKPHAMVAINVFAADTDEEARRLATSQQLQFLRLIRGGGGPLEPPVDSMDSIWPSEHERTIVEGQQRFSAIGSPSTIRAKLRELQELTQADEWIAAGQIYEHAARLHSYELLAEVVREGF